MKLFKFLILILLLLPLSNFSGDSIDAQDSADSCTDVVQVAIDAAALLCDDINRHEACYGNALVEAEIQQDNEESHFNVPGDLLNIASLRSLRLSPLNLDENYWGVVEMSLQANIPASLPENITLVIFGDVSISSPTSSLDQILEVTPSQATIDVYAEPWILAEVVGELAEDEVAIAQARTEDGEWLQVSLPATGDFGWIETADVENTDAIDALEVVDHEQAFQSPMQAFYFENGTNDVCSAFPTDGLLIQTPEGLGQVNLLINEVDIQLGSTAFIQAHAGEFMRFVLLEGHAQITADSVSYDVLPGMMTEIPMSADMRASGPPSRPTAFDLRGLEHLPLRLLSRQFVMGPPPNTDAAASTTEDDGTDAATTDEDNEDTANNTNTGNNGSNTTGGNNGGNGGSATTPPPGTTPPPATTPPPPPPTDPPPTPDSVTICHNGNNTLTVDWNSWINGHSKHGDTLGACP